MNFGMFSKAGRSDNPFSGVVVVVDKEPGFQNRSNKSGLNKWR